MEDTDPVILSDHWRTYWLKMPYCEKAYIKEDANIKRANMRNLNWQKRK